MPRPISKFCLTIPRYSIKDVLITILKHELSAKKFVVSKEVHHLPAMGAEEEHLHAYFELDPDTQITAIDEVRQWIQNGFIQVAGEENAPKGFDIQSAKRPDKWLKYITKVSMQLACNRAALWRGFLDKHTPKRFWQVSDFMNYRPSGRLNTFFISNFRKISNPLLSTSVLSNSTCDTKYGAYHSPGPLTQLIQSLSPIQTSGDLSNAYGLISEDANQGPYSCSNSQQSIEMSLGSKNSKHGGNPGKMLMETQVGPLRKHTQPWSVRRMQVKRLLLDIYALV